MDELVINYHVTKECNYSCRYCYAKWEKFQEKELWRDRRKTRRILKELHSFFHGLGYSGIRLNIAGGEPCLVKDIGEIIDYSSSLGFNVSLITNGSRISWPIILRQTENLAMLGVSVDSVHSETNRNIGRHSSSDSMATEEIKELLFSVRNGNPDIKLKINTVVSKWNKEEYLGDFIKAVSPDKWKIFKVLPVYSSIEGVRETDFAEFIKRHGNIDVPTYIENNDRMIDSYIMVDSIGRFYQNSKMDDYIYSDEILKVGAEKAFGQIKFEKNKYIARYTPSN